MVYDREITISIGASRKETKWQRKSLLISQLYERLSTPMRGVETVEEFFRMPKSRQDELKDTGGFVGGELADGRRKAANVIKRDLISLDLDTIPGYSVQTILDKLDSFGCSYCVYSTRKHVPNAPRLRIIIPTGRSMTVDEYEPVARKIAELIGIQYADPTTFEASRLMYWPSVCADGEFVYRAVDAQLVDVEMVLGQYRDWHNIAEWPQVPGADVTPQRLAATQEDPTTKKGIVGAFCRCFDIHQAISTFLSGVYSPCEGSERYTYLGGSTTGGAVIYGDGKWLYSFHATDPCSCKLVNAFDLVRLHKFGSADEQCDPTTPINSLPSTRLMGDFANTIDAVAVELYKERQQLSGENDFAGLLNPTGEVSGVQTVTGGSAGQEGQQDLAWVAALQRDAKGAFLQTIDNVLIILHNDPRLAGRFAMNEFSGLGEVLGVLPWDNAGRRRAWSDTDISGMYWYLERGYGITKRTAIDAALDIHASTHAFNEIADYLSSLVWDGTPRLDTLFIDYLGAEDNLYVREATRKMFVAAVARALHPGTKFDNMLILCGPQGLGKSTILDRMSRGFFNDSIRTFEGKEASELLQGVWLVEVAELDAFRRTDVARIKQFLSLRADRYRAAYGRNVKEAPRRCVFFGTCNVYDFLQDETGNRRFWPINVGKNPAKYNIFRELTEDVIGQLWAEAVVKFKSDEELYLAGDALAISENAQESHREMLVQEGIIRDFVSKPVPVGWASWDITRRREYWAGLVLGEVETAPRDRIFAGEIWCELYGRNIADATKTISREINAVLSRLDGWHRCESSIQFGVYGKQRGFVRDGIFVL